jgi:pyrimidine deaminase RibD-like protein
MSQLLQKPPNNILRAYRGCNLFEELTQTQKEARYNAFYMRCAFNAAELSFATRRKVGAIAVRHGNIVGFGFNGTPAGAANQCEDECGNTLPSVIHAEANLISKLNMLGIILSEVSIYVTKEPCKSCAGLIVNELEYLDSSSFKLFFAESSKTKPQEGLEHLYHLTKAQIFKVEKPC